MLIQNQIIKVKWHPSNKKYYENLGYEYTKIGDEFNVKLKDLTKGSKAYVDVKCDYCGEIFKRKYLNYNHQYTPELGDACDKCKNIKTQKSNIKKYGVNNVLVLDEVKEKIKNTCIKNYGVDHCSKSELCKEKAKQTSLERYGVSSYTKTEEYKEKTIKTNLEKYGVEHHMKLEESKNKSRKTSLEKYGTEFYTQTEEYKKRKKKTCLEKYGVEYPVQNEKIKEKIRKTCEERYGGIGYSSEILLKKIKESLFNNYGVYSPMQNNDIQKKARKTLYENGKVPTSKNQILIYNLLNEIYKDEECILNYPFSKINMDCMLNINNIKIDIEYDGWYWHKDKEKEDRKRDEFLKENGYKILRIKSKRKIPTKEQLIKAIDYLVKSNHSYFEIKLDI